MCDQQWLKSDTTRNISKPEKNIMPNGLKSDKISKGSKSDLDSNGSKFYIISYGSSAMDQNLTWSETYWMIRMEQNLSGSVSFAFHSLFFHISFQCSFRYTLAQISLFCFLSSFNSEFFLSSECCLQKTVTAFWKLS